MGTFLLYPMIDQENPPPSIADYVRETKQLFLDGSICGEPDERFAFSQRVFDIIEPLIPESVEDIRDDCLHKMLSGAKTHSGDENAMTSINSRGRSASVTRRLFTDVDGRPLIDEGMNEQLLSIINDYEGEKKTALKIVLFQETVTKLKGSQFDCHVIHKDIEIVETKPKPNLNLRTAYTNIFNRYRININTYNSRFSQLLKARVPMRDEHKLFGAGISSRHLSDAKKRFWYRMDEEFGIPDLAVLFLVDGSGSMSGPRRQSTMVASVILHEVLKKQGLTHAIAEHRAGGYDPIIKVNILVDFNAKDEEKYNLMALAAGGDNRDGLALFWAERYLMAHASHSQRLIIVLADGVPAHAYDDYFPPVSSKDTANAAAKIINRGTGIIAVALDDEDQACYDSLKDIYPSVISCTDLKRLTGQLLGIVSKNLQ